WELDAGDLAAAARRLRQADWRRGNARVHFAERVARAFIAAGRGPEGFALLAELQSDDNIDASLLAEAYWRLGAVEEGRTMMREAVEAAPDAAVREPAAPLPVAMAGIELAMGDRDSATAALHRMAELGGERIGLVRAPLAGRLAYAGLDTEAFALLEGVL